MDLTRMKPLKAWAIVDPYDPRKPRILGGSLRCGIFWTRSGALSFQRKDPKIAGFPIVPVIVTTANAILKERAK